MLLVRGVVAVVGAGVGEDVLEVVPGAGALVDVVAVVVGVVAQVGGVLPDGFAVVAAGCGVVPDTCGTPGDVVGTPGPPLEGVEPYGRVDACVDEVEGCVVGAEVGVESVGPLTDVPSEDAPMLVGFPGAVAECQEAEVAPPAPAAKAGITERTDATVTAPTSDTRRQSPMTTFPRWIPRLTNARNGHTAALVVSPE
jgi:hypothetical protein